MRGVDTKDERRAFAVGNAVYTARSDRLGTVILARADELVVESYLVVRRYYVLTHAEIDRHADGVPSASLILLEAKVCERWESVRAWIRPGKPPPMLETGGFFSCTFARA